MKFSEVLKPENITTLSDLELYYNRVVVGFYILRLAPIWLPETALFANSVCMLYAVVIVTAKFWYYSSPCC